MGLAFGGAGTNGRPADQISDVLRNDRIQQFRGRRQAALSQLQQQRTGPAQAGVDVVAAIEMGVVDQTLPTHRGAGLLEIHPHHDLKAVLEALTNQSQCAGVFLGRSHIVNRAGTNDHQQPLILAAQDALDPLTGLAHRFAGPIRQRQVAVQDGRCHQRAGLHHMQIGGGEHRARPRHSSP